MIPAYVLDDFYGPIRVFYRIAVWRVYGCVYVANIERGKTSF